jgi:hypothetical protein
MQGNGHTQARGIHDRSTHPILDADGHAVRFGGQVNPGLCEGTVIERPAAEVLGPAR